MEPYQQRIVQEKRDLDEKLAKLNAFERTELFASLPTGERGRLYQQYSVMKEYSRILGERIAAFTDLDDAVNANRPYPDGIAWDEALLQRKRAEKAESQIELLRRILLV